MLEGMRIDRAAHIEDERCGCDECQNFREVCGL
jgi:hypothetical protein